jgi:type IV pilus assembly protein PilC
VWTVSLFDYTGQLQSGQMFQGTLEADSHGHAEAMLADMGVRVTSLRPAQRTAYVAPLSLEDMLFFNEQLAALAKAAVPLEQGLRHLAADVGSRKLKRLLLDLAEELAAGTPLEQALEKHRRRFPTRYADVVRAGLQTGDLGGTLYGLTAHLRLKSHFRRVLLELAAYPIIVLIVATLIVSFFMRAVVPALEETILDFQVQLPTFLAAIFALAHNWPRVEVGIAAVAAALVILGACLCVPGARPVRERLLRHIPGFAQVYWSSVLARFVHTSALAAYSGTPLPELLAASGAASGSPALAGVTRRVAERMEQGSTLDQAAAAERDLPALWTCVVSTAAGRGELPAALEELARIYEERARQWVTTVHLLLGPVLVVCLGALLGSVIVTIFSMFASLLQGLSGA